MRALIMMFALVPASFLVACGGSASVGVKASSTTSLAQSADQAASAAGVLSSADALLLHVKSTDAHVVADVAADVTADDREAAKTGADGWTTISSQARDVDLKALAATPSDIAGGAVPSGRLTEIRLVLDDDDPADLVVAGAKTAVSVPSSSESGLKLTLQPPLDLSAGASEALAVQFDGTLVDVDTALELRPTLKLEAR